MKKQNFIKTVKTIFKKMANLLFYINDPNRNKIAVENPRGKR
jgi:hypothetical protein